MGYNFCTRRVSLLEIANIERAVKGNIYKSGTIYIQVSACRRAGLEQFFALKESREVENKYAVILPKFPVVNEYLLEALNRCADEFMFKYVGSNINIQIETFKYFMLDYHDDLDTQQFIAAFSQTINKALERSDSEMKQVKNLEKYMLANLMI